MEVLLWIIFIFLAIGYGFKLFFRYGMPWLLSYFMKQQQEKFSRAAGQTQRPEKKTEGEVKLKSKKKNRQTKDDREFGEYVDFEEM